MDKVGQRPADVNPSPLELARAFNDPKYWLELGRCLNDPEFWKMVWDEMKQHRGGLSVGFNVGANTYLLDYGGGFSFGVILGPDRKKDRLWNVFVNVGGGAHLGPQEKKLVGGGGGFTLSRDGLQRGVGIGAGRLNWSDDPLTGQGIGLSKMNTFGLSVGDMTTGASENYRLNSAQKYMDALLGAAANDLGVPKVSWAPGGNLQGPLVSRGPMGLIFSWIVYPTKDKLIDPVTNWVGARKASFESARSEFLDKTVGRVKCDQVEEKARRARWEPYSCREKLPGSE